MVQRAISVYIIIHLALLIVLFYIVFGRFGRRHEIPIFYISHKRSFILNFRFTNLNQILVFCRDVKLEESYFNRDVEKGFMTASSEAFGAKTKPSLKVANQVGNMYTPSVYSGLCSYIAG